MGNYVKVEDDLYPEGIPESISPALLERRIAKWEEIVERLTGQIFRTLTPGELTFDGNNSNILHFGLPLIAVTSVKVNGATIALAATEYRAHVGRQLPQDDRSNPKLELLGSRNRTIFRTSGSSIFSKGLDQLITATWGYLDESGNVPAPVKEAIIQLIALDAEGYWDQAQNKAGFPITPTQRERTDGHEIEYQQTEAIRITWMMLPVGIQHILGMYRRPWMMAVPDARTVISDDGSAYIYGF